MCLFRCRSSIGLVQTCCVTNKLHKNSICLDTIPVSPLNCNLICDRPIHFINNHCKFEQNVHSLSLSHYHQSVYSLPIKYMANIYTFCVNKTSTYINCVIISFPQFPMTFFNVHWYLRTERNILFSRKINKKQKIHIVHTRNVSRVKSAPIV